MSDADILLLTLEVEAAAARNASLSMALERLQSQLKRRGGDMNDSNRVADDPQRLGSQGDPLLFPVATTSSSTQTSNLYLEVEEPQARRTLAKLNDAFQDLEECMAFVRPSERVSSPGRRARSDYHTIEKAASAVACQSKNLKEACRTRIAILERDNAELEKLLDAQRNHIKKDDLVQKEKIGSLEEKILNLQAEYDSLERRQAHLSQPANSSTLSENERLKLDNEALTSALAKLQHEITYVLPKDVTLNE